MTYGISGHKTHPTRRQYPSKRRDLHPRRTFKRGFHCLLRKALPISRLPAQRRINHQRRLLHPITASGVYRVGLFGVTTMNFHKPPTDQFIGLLPLNGYIIKITRRRKRRKTPVFTPPCSQPPGSMAINSFGVMTLKHET